MKKTQWDFIAYAANTVGQIAILVEVINIWQTDDVVSLTWPFVLMSLAAAVLGLVYGIKNKITPFVVAGIFDLVIIMILLCLKVHKFNVHGKKEDK